MPVHPHAPEESANLVVNVDEFQRATGAPQGIVSRNEESDPSGIDHPDIREIEHEVSYAGSCSFPELPPQVRNAGRDYVRPDSDFRAGRRLGRLG